MTLVSEVIKSAQAYLDFLDKNQGKRPAFPLTPQNSPICWTDSWDNGQLAYSATFSTSSHSRFEIGSSILVRRKAPAPSYETTASVGSYDRKTGTIVLIFKNKIDFSSGEIIIDFKWLIKRLVEWLQNHNNLLDDPPFQVNKPLEDEVVNKFLLEASGRGMILTKEQEAALKAAINLPFSYIWGVPGSGKTDYVLSLAVVCLIKNGRRVAISAPTNLSVENALRSIMKRMKLWDLPESMVLRKGIASPDFIQEFPNSIESALALKRLKEINDRINQLKGMIELRKESTDVLLEIENCKTDLSALSEKKTAFIERFKKMDSDFQSIAAEKATKQKQIDRNLADEKRVDGELLHLKWVPTWLSNKKKGFLERRTEVAKRKERLTKEKDDLLKKADSIIQDMKKAKNESAIIQGEMRKMEANIEKLRSKASALELLLKQDPQLATKQLSEIEKEIAECENKKTSLRLDSNERMVLGFTLDHFTGAQLLAPCDNLFIDEAAYAHLAKFIPLLSLKCPTSLFGDHFQLPPVCEADDNDLKITAYWGQSCLAFHCAYNDPKNYQDIASFFPTIPSSPKKDTAIADPLENFTDTLGKSFRYDARLGKILGDCIYNLKVDGTSGDETELWWIDAPPNPRSTMKKRESKSEAESAFILAKKILGTYPDESIAILTPYTNQANLIKNLLRGMNISDIEVLNTHRAQGREWDTVIFSAVDIGQPPNGLWFCNSCKPPGSQVLATTISRVKKRLYLVLDASFWRRNPDQLLCQMISIGKKVQI